MFDLDHTIARSLFTEPLKSWEVLPEIKTFLQLFAQSSLSQEYTQIEQDVWVGRNVAIDSNVTILGAAIIGHDSSIRHCAYLRGDVIIGENVVVGNSSEVKNAILFDDVQVPHFNYVGDSILGYKAHMGAGSICSNMRSDKANIKVSKVDTGLRKFGALLGDRVEIGCNVVLNPGTIIGKDASVYPLTSVRGIIPERCIVKSDGSIVEKK